MQKFSWMLLVLLAFSVYAEDEKEKEVDSVYAEEVEKETDSAAAENASAEVKMLDVVHLTDGNMVTGEIIETIPKETIKIKTTDGKLITYPFDQIEKIDRVEVEFKNRTTATVRAAVFPNISGRFTFLWNTCFLGLGPILQWSVFKSSRFPC